MIKKPIQKDDGSYIFPDISDLLPDGDFPCFTKWFQTKAAIYKKSISKKKFPTKEERGEKLDSFLARLTKVHEQLTHYYWPPNDDFHYWHSCGGSEFEEIRVRLVDDLDKLISIGDAVKNQHMMNSKRRGRPNKLLQDIDLYMVYKNLAFTKLNDQQATLNANEILKRYGYYMHEAIDIKDLFDNIKRSIRKGEKHCKRFNLFNEQNLMIKKDVDPIENSQRQ